MTIQLPEFLQHFENEAKQYLSKGLVRDTEFSGSTYQVQVFDAKTGKEVWVFLQLDASGQIKDCFCSCEQGEENSHCVHLAAAYLSIFNENGEPLHQRFQNSLWNKLCLLYAKRIGDDPSLLTVEGAGKYSFTSAGGKQVFFVKGKNPEAIAKLKEIIEERNSETEETSIKFSNLSQEEISLWRQGRPSDQLRYELSFWNDFAHWLMQQQESGAAYKITFGYSPKEIPNHIEIAFPEIGINFYLSEANLPLIIPALKTIQSPVKIHLTEQEKIQKLTYDKKTGEMHVFNKPSAAMDKTASGHAIDGWKYIPGEGFYETQQIFNKPKICGEELIDALNTYPDTIQTYLEGTAFSSDPFELSYALSFDAQWNLHINAYAFSPGDLSEPYSRFLGSWIYLDGKGFYKILKPHFEADKTVVSKEEIPDFIRRERAWLNTQEGFYVHLFSIESQIAYVVSPDNKLSFKRQMLEKSHAGKDFGLWFYLAGEGFFSKASAYTSLPVSAETVIPAEQIPFFIHMHRAELELIPNFLSDKCPISRVSLSVDLVENGIQISPIYELRAEYSQKDVRFFDDYTYVENEGFHELGQEFLLPERYRQGMYIASENVPAFLVHDFENITQYSTEIDPRLIKPKTLQLTAENIEKDPTFQHGWYNLQLGYQTERGFISLFQIVSAIRKRRKFLFTDAGLIDLSDKRFDWIRQLPKNRIDKSNNLHLPILELIRLHSLQEIDVQSSSPHADGALEKIRELTEFHVPAKPNLAGLQSELRPYQEIGVSWLWFLFTHELSGLLCDDMGLGKTHQAMALLSAIINRYKESSGLELPKFLVVCPTSVLYHWQEKLAEFLPELRVHMFYGSERNLKDFENNGFDLLLTSYGIWRMEYAKLADIFFEVAILDELQIAKNHHSRIYLSLRHINARMRIGLTGTPIENHLRELKALFDLVVPGYMPSEADYRELFMKPIERENDPNRRLLLQRFVKPFILRRKKKEVLEDLPEKVEEIAHCNLSPEQQRFYNETIQQSRKSLLDQLQDRDSPVPYIHVFAILSALKQICNHPAAFLKKPQDYKKYESGKWDLFVELLNEARDSKQKVVVFSQYLAMLDIFELYLEEENIGFATIRGATINRGEQVRKFNHDPACEVFLGSLQAAGLGVDLTAGSVVIHYDRWWNAARENQATDRVHRIGQVRGVEVFKMVTKGTFEERIDALIAKKGKLMEDVVRADDPNFLKKFDRSEILQLLQEVEESKIE